MWGKEIWGCSLALDMVWWDSLCGQEKACATQVQNQGSSGIIRCNTDECCQKHLGANSLHLINFGNYTFRNHFQLIKCILIPSVTSWVIFLVPRIMWPEQFKGGGTYFSSHSRTQPIMVVEIMEMVAWDIWSHCNENWQH